MERKFTFAFESWIRQGRTTFTSPAFQYHYFSQSSTKMNSPRLRTRAFEFLFQFCPIRILWCVWLKTTVISPRLITLRFEDFSRKRFRHGFHVWRQCRFRYKCKSPWCGFGPVPSSTKRAAHSTAYRQPSSMASHPAGLQPPISCSFSRSF